MSFSLSICIPVYNYNITQLVDQLLEQCKNTHIDYEILIYDDHSLAQFREQNQTIRNRYNVTYIELAENIGRSKIRNLLARDAQKDFLLFLDCDVLPQSKHFIDNYLKAIDKDTEVIIGGRTHLPTCEPYQKLRWVYGREREETKAKERCATPYQSFMTNNFLIKKDIFNLIQFSEDLKGYGHEDTYFGYELKHHQKEIKHIDNPAIHIGLEDAKTFIRKTEEGIKNLSSLYKTEVNNTLFIDDIKLLSFVNKHPKIARILYKKWKVLRAFYLKNLLSESPNLRFFDFYKLGFFMDQIEEKSEKLK